MTIGNHRNTGTSQGTYVQWQRIFMKQIDKVKPIPDDLMIREFPQLEASDGKH
jgi:hypothetical protein